MFQKFGIMDEFKEKGSGSKRVFACLYYITCAICLTLINKFLFSPQYEFHDPLFLTISQLSATLLLLLLFSLLEWIALPPLRMSDVKVVFPLSFTYIMMLYFGLIAIGNTNLVMYNTLRRLGIFFVIALQFIILGTKPSLQVWGAVFVLFSGTVLAASTDLTFNAFGYFWVFLCNLATALYIVLIKHVKNQTGLDPFGILFYNSLLSLPTVVLGYLFLGQSDTFTITRSADFWVLFLLTTIMGFFINHSIFVNTSENSPLTQAVAGQAKDIILLVASFFVDYVFDFRNFIGVIIGLSGSALYALVKYNESQNQNKKLGP